MRRSLLLAYAAITCLSLAPGHAAFAQGSGRTHGATAQDADDEAARKKRDEEWGEGAKLDLPGAHNAGPCPYVKVLYDAGRFIEFKDGKVASGAVEYTGEIQGLSSGCRYKGADPIHVEAEVLFGLGRGPQADGSSHVYRYWVAVTDRNQAVLAKEYFTVDAKFPVGKDRILVTDHIANITIPRADAQVSGSNFEVLIGFDVTPEMAAFNRDGKRFRINAGTTASTASVAAAQQ